MDDDDDMDVDDGDDGIELGRLRIKFVMDDENL